MKAMEVIITARNRCSAPRIAASLIGTLGEARRRAPQVVVPRQRIDMARTGKLQLAATEKAPRASLPRETDAELRLQHVSPRLVEVARSSERQLLGLPLEQLIVADDETRRGRARRRPAAERPAEAAPRPRRASAPGRRR